MKKVIIIFSIFIILLGISTISIATIDPDTYKPKDIVIQDAGRSLLLSQKIIGGITVTGIVISVIVTMILGIKYMVGSVDQRAEYRKTMIPILIGMMLLFGTSWIIKILFAIVPKNIS